MIEITGAKTKHGKNSVYTLEVSPVKGLIKKDPIIVGWDSEYDSQTNELLSMQFSCQKKNVFIPIEAGEITFDEFLSLLEYFIKDIVGISNPSKRPIHLFTFFSIAELQHLDVKNQSYITLSENVRSNTATIKRAHNPPIVVDDLIIWAPPGYNLDSFAKLFGLEKKI